MEEFQKLLQESLQHAGFYIYHPTDFNIASSNAHVFTMRKDADFICGCPHTKRIFWVESKNTKGRKFYSMQGKSNMRQFTRALEIDSKFGSYFYVVNFSEMDIVAYFNPSLIEETNIFNPLEYDGLRIERLSQVKETVFGQTRVRSLLDMSFLSEILEEPLSSETGF
jgi:hypothetical protein